MMQDADLERLAEQLYDALKAVQIALYEGEDENDQQIEAALYAWERRHSGADHEPDNPQGVWCCQKHRQEFQSRHHNDGIVT